MSLILLRVTLICCIVGCLLSLCEGQFVFEPKELLFVDVPALIPKISEFYITNSFPHEVQITSIHSESSHFHIIMFQPTVLSSGAQISIQILFLPYFQYDSANASVFLESTEGSFSYNVYGRATMNPYKLIPLIGHRIPFGTSSYERPIVMYNPYDEPLHIREVYTTEDFLSLRGSALAHPFANDANGSEPALRQNSATSAVDVSSPWVLDSGIEREILSLAIDAKFPGKYSGYVHIKTDRDNLVLPVEAMVLEGTVHAKPDVLNFGILTRGSISEPLSLRLVNSAAVPIAVLDVVPSAPDPYLQIDVQYQNQHHQTLFQNHNDRLDFERAIENSALVLPAVGVDDERSSSSSSSSHSTMGRNEVTEVLVAKLSYNPVDGHDNVRTGTFRGKILVFTNNSNPATAVIEVPYEGTVLQGGIGFDQQQAVFVIGETLRHVPCAACVIQKTSVDSSSTGSRACSSGLQNQENSKSQRQSLHRPSGVSLGSSGGLSLHARPVSESKRRLSASIRRNDAFSDCDHEDTLHRKKLLDKVLANANEAEKSLNMSREFTFTNYFSVPVSLQLISTATCGEMLVHVDSPSAAANANAQGQRTGRSKGKRRSSEAKNNLHVAQSLQPWPPIKVDLQTHKLLRASTTDSSLLPFTCWLELWTNVSSHRIPLHIISGLLDLSVLNARVMRNSCFDSSTRSRRRNRNGVSESDDALSSSGAATPSKGTKSANETLFIDLGKVSAIEPRPLLLELRNPNPTGIPLSISIPGRIPAHHHHHHGSTRKGCTHDRVGSSRSTSFLCTCMEDSVSLPLSVSVSDASADSASAEESTGLLHYTGNRRSQTENGSGSGEASGDHLKIFDGRMSSENSGVAHDSQKAFVQAPVLRYRSSREILNDTSCICRDIENISCGDKNIRGIKTQENYRSRNTDKPDTDSSNSYLAEVKGDGIARLSISIFQAGGIDDLSEARGSPAVSAQKLSVLKKLIGRRQSVELSLVTPYQVLRLVVYYEISIDQVLSESSSRSSGSSSGSSIFTADASMSLLFGAEDNVRKQKKTSTDSSANSKTWNLSFPYPTSPIPNYVVLGRATPLAVFTSFFAVPNSHNNFHSKPLTKSWSRPWDVKWSIQSPHFSLQSLEPLNRSCWGLGEEPQFNNQSCIPRTSKISHQRYRSMWSWQWKANLMIRSPCIYDSGSPVEWESSLSSITQSLVTGSIQIAQDDNFKKNHPEFPTQVADTAGAGGGGDTGNTGTIPSVFGFTRTALLGLNSSLTAMASPNTTVATLVEQLEKADSLLQSILVACRTRPDDDDANIMFDSDGRFLPTALHTQISRLRSSWIEAFSSNISRQPLRIPDADLLVDAMTTFHRYVIRGPVIMPHFVIAPHTSEIVLPLLRQREIALVYLRVSNPFEMPVSFSLKRIVPARLNGTIDVDTTTSEPFWFSLSKLVRSSELKMMFSSPSSLSEVDVIPIADTVLSPVAAAADESSADQIEVAATSNHSLVKVAQFYRLAVSSSLLGHLPDAHFLTHSQFMLPPSNAIPDITVLSATIQPMGSALLGPVVFVPEQMRSPMNVDDDSFDDHRMDQDDFPARIHSEPKMAIDAMLIVNNFTGVDKFIFHGRAGSPKLTLRDVSIKYSGTATGSDIRNVQCMSPGADALADSKNGSLAHLVCSEDGDDEKKQQQQQVMVGRSVYRYRINLNVSHRQESTHQSLTVIIANDGSVPSSISDILVDGQSCRHTGNALSTLHLSRLIQSWIYTFLHKISFGFLFMTVTDLPMETLCKQLPIVVPSGGNTTARVVLGPLFVSHDSQAQAQAPTSTLCAYATQRRRVELVSEDGGRGDSSSTPEESVRYRLWFIPKIFTESCSSQKDSMIIDFIASLHPDSRARCIQSEELGLGLGLGSGLNAFHHNLHGDGVFDYYLSIGLYIAASFFTLSLLSLFCSATVTGKRSKEKESSGSSGSSMRGSGQTRIRRALRLRPRLVPDGAVSTDSVPQVADTTNEESIEYSGSQKSEGEDETENIFLKAVETLQTRRSTAYYCQVPEYSSAPQLLELLKEQVSMPAPAAPVSREETLKSTVEVLTLPPSEANIDAILHVQVNVNVDMEKRSSAPVQEAEQHELAPDQSTAEEFRAHLGAAQINDAAAEVENNVLDRDHILPADDTGTSRLEDLGLGLKFRSTFLEAMGSGEVSAESTGNSITAEFGVSEASRVPRPRHDRTLSLGPIGLGLPLGLSDMRGLTGVESVSAHSLEEQHGYPTIGNSPEITPTKELWGHSTNSAGTGKADDGIITSSLFSSPIFTAPLRPLADEVAGGKHNDLDDVGVGVGVGWLSNALSEWGRTTTSTTNDELFSGGNIFASGVADNGLMPLNTGLQPNTFESGIGSLLESPKASLSLSSAADFMFRGGSGLSSEPMSTHQTDNSRIVPLDPFTDFALSCHQLAVQSQEPTSIPRSEFTIGRDQTLFGPYEPFLGSRSDNIVNDDGFGLPVDLDIDMMSEDESRLTTLLPLADRQLPDAESVSVSEPQGKAVSKNTFVPPPPGFQQPKGAPR